MKTILTLIFGITLLTACHSKKNVAATVENKPVVEKYKFENVSPSDSLFASIRKGACFGQCPIYTINIYCGGTAILEGKNFVEKIGTYKKQLSYQDMLKFVTVAKEINYLELDDNYDNKNVTDLPATLTSIVIDKTRKKIRNRFQGPKELRTFELLFSDLLKSGGWVKVENSNKDKF